MTGAYEIKPLAIYDEAVLRAEIGLLAAAVRRARRSRKLRYTRQGKRLFYLGSWILDWRSLDASPAAGW